MCWFDNYIIVCTAHHHQYKTCQDWHLESRQLVIDYSPQLILALPQWSCQHSRWGFFLSCPVCVLNTQPPQSHSNLFSAAPRTHFHQKSIFMNSNIFGDFVAFYLFAFTKMTRLKNEIDEFLWLNKSNSLLLINWK